MCIALNLSVCYSWKRPTSPQAFSVETSATMASAILSSHLTYRCSTWARRKFGLWMAHSRQLATPSPSSWASTLLFGQREPWSNFHCALSSCPAGRRVTITPSLTASWSFYQQCHPWRKSSLTSSRPCGQHSRSRCQVHPSTDAGFTGHRPFTGRYIHFKFI